MAQIAYCNVFIVVEGSKVCQSLQKQKSGKINEKRKRKKSKEEGETNKKGQFLEKFDLIL